MVIPDVQQVSLRWDSNDVLRVGNTRVRLATVIFAYNEGYTAEEIVSHYPSLSLADVYTVLAYSL